MNARLVLLIMVMLSSPIANATLINVEWQGMIRSSGLPGVIDIGDTIGGSYLIDTARPPLHTLTGNGHTGSATYQTVTPLAFSVNSFNIIAGDSTVEIANDVPNCYMVCLWFDDITVASEAFRGASIGGLPIELFELRFMAVRFEGEAEPNPLSDLSMPDHFDLDEWTYSAYGRIVLEGSVDVSFGYQYYTQTSVASVPGPGTVGLFGLGLAGLILRCNVRRKVLAN